MGHIHACTVRDVHEASIKMSRTWEDNMTHVTNVLLTGRVFSGLGFLMYSHLDFIIARAAGVQSQKLAY
jgi:hypothetical protein